MAFRYQRLDIGTMKLDLFPWHARLDSDEKPYMKRSLIHGDDENDNALISH